MTKWLTVLMACLALGLVAGCGGDDDDDEGGGAAETTEQPAETTEDTGGGGGGGGAEAVSLENITFNPAELSVSKGTTVTWTNDESVGHDVTKTGGPGPDFSSGDPGGMGQDDTFEQTFDTAGTIEYVCTVHPNMTGTITVK